MNPRLLRRYLVWICSGLVGVGTIMIYSASSIYADQLYGDGSYFLKRHIFFIIIGAIASIVVMMVDLNRLRKWVWSIWGIGCFFLVYVSVFSPEIAGARRWFSVGPFHIQPSEIIKICMIAVMADWISKKGTLMQDFKKGVGPALGILGLTCILVLAGRDFGTTMVIAIVGILMLFVAQIRWKHLLGMVGALIPLGAIAILIEPYRIRRMVGFLNPWQDIRDTGFQLYQSLLAIGSGGVFGVGLGQSQQKLFYLPAAHTDFIYAIIGEELGWVGASGVLVMYALITMIGIKITLMREEAFERTFCFGLVMLIAVEAMINIGVSIGALPTKGLALPFISYGGSSLIVKMVAIAIILNLSRKRSSEAHLNA